MECIHEKVCYKLSKLVDSIFIYFKHGNDKEAQDKIDSMKTMLCDMCINKDVKKDQEKETVKLVEGVPSNILKILGDCDKFIDSIAPSSFASVNTERFMLSKRIQDTLKQYSV